MGRKHTGLEDHLLWLRAWLERHPRFVFDFRPTCCSWFNAVVGFFVKLSRRRLKRGVFCSVVDLQAAINRVVTETKANSRPFTSNADPDRIIAAVGRRAPGARFRPITSHPDCRLTGCGAWRDRGPRHQYSQTARSVFRDPAKRNNPSPLWQFRNATVLPTAPSLMRRRRRFRPSDTALSNPCLRL